MYEKYLSEKFEKAINVVNKGRYEDSGCEFTTFATTVPD